VQDSGCETQFVLAEPGPISRWLSDYLETSVALNRETEKGFPDDREAYGPTILSEPTLRTVASWYPGMTLESARRRFRANLELEGVDAPPFWEDRLYRAAGELLPFHIGAVRFLGHNPCQRCVVPTRDPDTGQPTPGFQKDFMERRSQTLPDWANRSRFNHFYRLAINTSVPASEAGKLLRSGDVVHLELPSTQLAVGALSPSVASGTVLRTPFP
jgi:hypothetical protein